MAICKICGAVDEQLPEHWTAWECPQCEDDRLITASEPIDIKAVNRKEANMRMLKVLAVGLVLMGVCWGAENPVGEPVGVLGLAITYGVLALIGLGGLLGFGQWCFERGGKMKKVLLVSLLLCSLAVAANVDYTNALYVTTTGSDAATGTGLANARLTIADAITDAKANPNLSTIIIYPGTYTEALDLSATTAAGIRLIGCGYNTVITQSDPATKPIKVGNGQTFENLRITHTGTPTDSGQCVCVVSSGPGKTGLRFKNIWVETAGTGIILPNITDVVIEGCRIKGGEAGVALNVTGGIGTYGIERPVQIKDSTIQTTGWTICSTAALEIFGNATVQNCVIMARKENADTTYLAYGFRTGSSSAAADINDHIIVALQNTSISALSGGAADAVSCIGLTIGADTEVSLDNCPIFVTPTKGKAIGISCSTGTAADMLVYAETPVDYGTQPTMPQVAGTPTWRYPNIGSNGAVTLVTTTTTNTDALTADAVKTALETDGSKLDVLYDDWLDGGRLDLILDKSAKFGRY